MPKAQMVMIVGESTIKSQRLKETLQKGGPYFNQNIEGENPD